jgi:poly-gamma-glutamate synthase PgsB/CapB
VDRVFPQTLRVVLVLAGCTIGALHVEWQRHRRALARVPVRIFVNGTRGKSSVTRLIAAVLRASGTPTVGKTTGTCSRLILPDGSETPVPRDGPPNIAELIRTLRSAVRLGAEAVVFECMAVDPDLQRIAEERIVQPTITVVTNARLDHTDVQGASVYDIARGFAARPGGVLVTADPIVARAHEPRLEASGGRAVVSRASSVDPSELRDMTYVEHPENVALALEVARLLGVDRATALRAILTTAPDPGAATVFDLPHPSGSWQLVNLFAANDPESTFQALDSVEAAYGRLDRPLLLFAARGDRTARSAEFARVLEHHRERFHGVLVFGERTRAVVRTAHRAGLDDGWIVDAGDPPPAELTKMLADSMGTERTVVGVGNIIGPAQRWLEHLAATVESEQILVDRPELAGVA